MLKTKKCEKCNNIMRMGIVDYKTKIYNHNVIINDIEGYQCFNCGNIEPRKGTEQYLEEKILEKRLKLLETLDVKPIYISNIKNIREKKGLSQRQVADVLGVAEQRFSAIERNVNTPTILITYALAYFFGVSSDDLYELIYVSEEFYNKLLNLELVETKDGVEFNYIKEAEETRNDLNKIRNEIDNINKELRQYRLRLKKGEIEKKEGKGKIKAIQDQKEKELEPIKESLEKELTSIERKHNFIIKQNYIVSREDWNEVEKQYKEELKETIS